MNYDDAYNEDYYNRYIIQEGAGGYLQSSIQRKILHDIAYDLIMLCKPKSLLDVGCAAGYLVEAALSYDVDAFGMDVSRYIIENSVVPEHCIRHDVSQPYPFARSFDMVVCIEVMEHLPEKDAQRAIRFMCEHADRYIYFSSTPDDITEETHINVQTPEYWEAEFKKHGFIKYEYLVQNPLEWGMLFINEDIL